MRLTFVRTVNSVPQNTECSARHARNISYPIVFTLEEMRLVVALVLGLASVYAQTCVPTSIPPAGAVSGSFDDASCLLSDGTPYAAYRLDLPTRGRIRIDLSALNADLILRDSSGAKVDSGVSIRRPVEAGSYSLLVNSRSPGGALSPPSAWSVHTAFTAEPGMMCTAFPKIGLNQTIAGTLGASGCAMPDGTTYEGYVLSTFGSGTLTVSVASPDFTTVLILRDSEGYAIASDAAQLSTPVDGNNRYEIVVATSDQSGSYQLSTGFQPAEDETCRPRKSFTESASDSASINGESCSATAPSGDLTWYNFYTFTVPAAGLADLTASSKDFGATLNLLDDAGNALAVDTGGGPGAGQSEIRLQLRPGNYTAQVFSPAPSGGAYTFTYQLTPGPPQPCAPVAANPGDALAGALSVSSCRSRLGLADLYSFTLPASGTLDVSLAATSFGGLLAIRDGKDNLVLVERDAQGLGLSHLTADLPAGAYTIVAAAASGAGTYQVTSRFTAHDIAPCTFAQPLSINGGYIQKLGPGSCRGPNGQPVDLYQFTLPSDGVVAAFMTSSEVDGFLTIADAAGNILRSDDNTYGGFDSMIVQFLPAGDYQVAARAAGNTAGGYYQVDLRSVLAPRPPFCTAKGKLALGGSVTNALSVASCQYTDGTFADLYQVDLTSDTTIDLRLASGDFDAYLVLLDARGNVVDQDDDSGGNSDARVSPSLGAGTYFVVAKPSSDYTHIGAYSLSLGQ